MKTVWKWILGILLVVLVVGGLAALFFFWRNHQTLAFRPAHMIPGWNAPGPRDFGNRPGPHMGDGRGWDRPMFGHHRNGFMPFGGLFLLGGLLKLVFFGALLYGAYWLGRRNARLALDPSPGSGRPATPTPAPGRRVAKK